MWDVPVSRFASGEPAIATEDSKHQDESSSSDGIHGRRKEGFLRAVLTSKAVHRQGHAPEQSFDFQSRQTESILSDVMSPSRARFPPSTQELENVIEDAVSKGISRMGLLDKHAEMLEAITNVTHVNVDSPGLSPTLSALRNDVREAIAQINEVAQHTAGIRHNEKQDEVIQALSNIKVDLPAPDLSSFEQILQEVLREVRRTGNDFRRDVAASCQELRQEFAVLRQEAAESHREARDSTALMVSELRTLPQVLSDMKQVLKSLDDRVSKTEVAPVSSTVTAEVDVNILRDSVRNAFSDLSLQIDNSDVLHAIQALEPDHHALSTSIADKLRNVTWNVDHAEVLHHLRQLPDRQTIASTVQEEFNRSSFEVDNSELLHAIERLDRRLDFAPIVEAINSVDLDLTPIHEAIGKIKKTWDPAPVLEEFKRLDSQSCEALASAVYDRLCNHTFKVDQTELLHALSRATPHIDAHAVSEAVLERISCTKLPLDCSEMLEAIRCLEPDHQSLSAVLIDSMKKVTWNVDHGDVIRQLAHLPDQQYIANVVHEQLGQSRLNVDHSEVLRAIEQVGRRLDFTPILEAINTAEIDLGPIHDAIGKINLAVDHTPVLEEIQQLGKIDYEEIASHVLRRLDANARSNLIVDHTPVLGGIQNVAKIDYEELASAVHDRISRHTFKVDHTEVLQLLSSMGPGRIDAKDLSEAVYDKLLNAKLTVDSSEVLQAISRLEPDHHALSVALIKHMNDVVWNVDNGDVLRRLAHVPDQQAIATIVREELTQIDFTVDTTDLLQAIERLDERLDLRPLVDAISSIELDLTPIHDAIRGIQMNVDPAPLLQEIRRLDMFDGNAVASILYDRICNQTLKVDHTEVLQLLSGKRSDIDAQVLSEAVCQRLSTAKLVVECPSVLEAIKRLERDPDGRDVLPAALVERMKESTWNFDHREILRQLAQLSEKLSAKTADDQIRGHNLKMEHSEVINSIQNIENRLDFTPILTAIRSAALDLTPIHEVISKTMDFTKMLQELKELQSIDYERLASTVHDQICDHTFKWDQTDILQALSNTRPDIHALDSLVELRDMIERIDQRLDFTPLVDAISGIELDLTPIHDAISKTRMTVDPAPLLQEIRRLDVFDGEAIASNFYDRIRSHTFKVDQTEVLQQLSCMRPEVDTQALSEAVCTRLMSTKMAVACPDMLETIRTGFGKLEDMRTTAVKSDPAPVMNAINAMTVNLESVHERLGRMHNALDSLSGLVAHMEPINLGLIPAVEKICQIEFPNVELIADAVSDKMRLVKWDNSDVVSAIQTMGNDLAVRHERLLKAIDGADVDLAPATDAIAKVDRALVKMMDELRQLRADRSESCVNVERKMRAEGAATRCFSPQPHVTGSYVSVAERSEHTAKVTTQPLLSQPVQTMPFSWPVAQAAQAVGSCVAPVRSAPPRMHSMSPTPRSTAPVMSAAVPTFASAPRNARTPTPRKSQHIQMELLASNSDHSKYNQTMPKGVSFEVLPARPMDMSHSVEQARLRGMSFEVLPARPMDMPQSAEQARMSRAVDLPVPKLLEQRNVEIGHSTAPPMRKVSYEVGVGQMLSATSSTSAPATSGAHSLSGLVTETASVTTFEGTESEAPIETPASAVCRVPNCM